MGADKGCGCGKPKPKPQGGGQQAFALTQNGSTQRFGSKLERDAAWVRGGKAGTRQP